ncbi:MAG: ROK family transcriptional regulator [Burkholderiales bacterium]|nr:ROK family transcriptional regulator [Burkholderiales bacterium]
MKHEPAGHGAADDAPAPLRPRGSSQLGMRQFNERVVLHALRLHGDLPKAELARLTGLTAQTMGLITTRLEEDGLLLRRERVRGRIGQPSIPLGLNPKGAFAIGIKIGRRSTDCLLVDFTGTVQKRLGLAYRFPAIEELLPAIADNLRALRRSLGPLSSRLVGTGVAVPFFMGGWHRLLGLSQAQAEAWNRVDLAGEIQALTKLPVSYAKDTSAACVAELVQGRGRQIKSYLYLYVDTFVGGGLVLGSKLHAGVHGNAGAVASLPVAQARGPNPPGQLVADASLWELEQVFAAHELDTAAAYDDRAMRAPWLRHTQAWTRSAANALAQCIVAGMAFVDVDAVVLDGSLSREALAALLAEAGEALKRYNWEGLWTPALHAGTIGPDARALGGALLPLHENFAPHSEIFLKAEAG